MGIKNLNKFIRDNCSNSIKSINLMDLKNKIIVIDISIYMYKYKKEDSLIENIYLMLSIFKHYNINAVFIFDGKPPDEKKDILVKRKLLKRNAENEYYSLKKELIDNFNINNNEKQDIINNMNILKKNFIYIKKEEIIKIKELIISYGASFIDAIGEADELCALLVLKNKAWACLSEDMDMFVYGCPRVLRYFSLLNHTCILYDTKLVIENLKINQTDFRQICVLSGTDYNENNNNNTLYDNLKLFKKYKYYNNYVYKNNYDFYKWLIACYPDYIFDYNLLIKIYNLFNIENNETYKLLINNINLLNTNIINKEKINFILKEDGFIL